MINSNNNSRKPPVTASTALSVHNENVIVVMPNTMKYSAIVEGTKTDIVVPNATTHKTLTKAFKKKIVVDTINMKNTNILFVAPKSIEIKSFVKGAEKVYIVPTTKIAIFRIATNKDKDFRAAMREMELTTNPKVNDSDDGNCGTELKHKSEPEL
ncbi:hypothetical protein SAMN02910317_03029 [Ruminococcaceae bacterium FB2012]|nr:hypothetical protein SAMN02910317_03029 [Ruminococcaceae bacterium FB2012]